MLQKIFYYLVPYPLMEKFVFSNRVVTSWIFLGSVIYILMILSTPGIPLYEGFIYVLTSVIAYCFLGLLGLAIDKKRGKDWEYNGLYWWFYPIISLFYISFSLNMIICSIVGFFMGVSGSGKRPTSDYKPSLDEIAKDILKKTPKEILDNYGDELEELADKYPTRKKILEKLEKNPGVPITELLTKEEIEIFAQMILEMIAQ